MQRKGDMVISSTFMFILGLILLLILVVFYVYLKGKGISIIEGGIRLPSPSG